MVSTRSLQSFAVNELTRGVLAGDEVMVQGIDYTSVSPICSVPRLFGLVSVVHIFPFLFSCRYIQYIMNSLISSEAIF
jgi:hypothetical protein